MADRPWDAIAEKSYCPSCEESLALGEGAPLIERAEKSPCAVCGQIGILRYRTLPLHKSAPVEIDLCATHLRDLLGRRLGPFAFHQLQRLLTTQGLDVREIFLLHESFYDRQGRALRPILIEE
jgi:hypothetical protein